CSSCTCGTQPVAMGTTCSAGGGVKCDGNGSCVQCFTSTDCTNPASPVCTMGVCAPATCTDGKLDGAETATDCGGGQCPPCAVGSACKVNTDCQSGVCDATSLKCVAPPPNNMCATAEMHTLNPGDPALVVTATTHDSTSLYQTNCTSQSNPSVVYALNLTGEGTFSANITAAAGSPLLPVMEIRTDCTQFVDVCTSYGTSSANTDTDLTLFAQDFNQTMAAGTYYIIVTGSGGTSGAFTLTAQLTPAKCGDAVINANEVCDPGAAVDGDGCGAPGSANACQYIARGNPGGGPAGSDTCPGEAVAIPAGTTILTDAKGYSTWGYADDYVGSCLAAGNGATGSGDRVFQLTPAKSGTMTATVGLKSDGITSACGTDLWGPECWSPMIYARSTCATASTELACATGGPAGGENPYSPQVISFPVT